MIESFFQFGIDLKKIRRKGWIKNLKIKNPESVADHSFSTTLMSMVLGDLMKLDTQKIMKMSLLHDLAECIVGDLTPEEISKKEKVKLENTAISKILEKLPDPLHSEYKKIWHEYQMKQSKEAKLFNEIDKLEMVFQARNYIENGFSDKMIKPFLNTANKQIKNKKLKKILKNLIET